jgi:hypothetical protein
MGRSCNTNVGTKNAYRSFVAKPEGKKPLGRDRLTCVDNTVVYRPVAGQRPRNGRVQPLLRNRRINKHPFLSNGR